jgi:hypothetical protein
MHRPLLTLMAVLAGAGGAVTAVSVAGAQPDTSSGSGTALPGTTATGTPAETGPPVAGTKQQTHPAVHPRHPARRSHVGVQFTLSDAPGHQGVVENGYRIQVDAPAGSRPACAAPAPPDVTSGTHGARVTVGLPHPRHGWCGGRYAVTIFLQRGPYCAAPQAGQPPQPCPLFASQELQVGRTAFVVRAPRR